MSVIDAKPGLRKRRRHLDLVVDPRRAVQILENALHRLLQIKRRDFAADHLDAAFLIELKLKFGRATLKRESRSKQRPSG
jgi:hypothetical protein